LGDVTDHADHFAEGRVTERSRGTTGADLLPEGRLAGEPEASGRVADHTDRRMLRIVPIVEEAALAQRDVDRPGIAGAHDVTVRVRVIP
jgi:hypothetical protein